MRMLRVKEDYKCLGILEAETIKQAKMKENEMKEERESCVREIVSKG